MTNNFAFCDTETTGLDPDLHQIYEVGLIVDDEEFRWFLSVDLGRADPVALKIGDYYGRHPSEQLDEIISASDLTSTRAFVEEFSRLTRGRHLVGAVISFDEERLRRLLKANGACPGWHYHIVDVEALVVGYLGGHGMRGEIHPPWDSTALSLAVKVDPDKFDRHTALGDARWAKALYEAVMGGA